MMVINGWCAIIALIYNSATPIQATASFVLKPGGGKEYVATPVNRNATLQCSAVNTSSLVWVINGFALLSLDIQLSSLTIHQSEPATASTGERTSTLTVNGATEEYAIKICCQIDGLQQCCTNLIVYDHPSSPENITIQNINGGSINITWDANSVAGVDQYYNVNFTSNTSNFRSTKPFLFLNQSIRDIQCGESLLITTVNGAGESSPSIFILPSLPDGIVSLEHQVWKVNGNILVQVSFEPAERCKYYPVKRYLLVVKSLPGKTLIDKFTLGYNETKTLLNGLEDNKMYFYSITAINRVGNTTTNSDKVLATSDVQNVAAMEIDEYTVKVHCDFVNGSDAQGCLVVFSSNITHVMSQSTELILMESHSTVVTLTHPISCYHQVFAFDIEATGNVSSLAIEGSFITTNQSQAGTVCPAVISQVSRIRLIVLCVTVAILLATIVPVILVFITVACHRSRSAGYFSTCGHKNSKNVENLAPTIHPDAISGTNVKRSSSIQTKRNEAYEFRKVDQ